MRRAIDSSKLEACQEEKADRGQASGADLGALARASAADLRLLWGAQRGSPPPAMLSARIMRLALAWEAQAAVEGGESSGDRRAWAAIMKRRAGGAAAAEAVSGLKPPPAPAGTRLMKTWGGETHEVIVLEEGALWRGRSYTSLSAIAFAMTGTRRNGPRFFGLRETR